MASNLAACSDAPRIADLLPYLPAELLASAVQDLEDLEDLKAGHQKCLVSSQRGAALLVDVTGFSALARSFTRSDVSTAAEELVGHLNEYFLKLMALLHARGCDVLLFAGDAIMAFVPAGEGRSLAAAALAAIGAAADVRAIAFERGGHRLTAHTGVGVGELHAYLLRAGPKAAQALFAGGLVAQVCEAQRASKGDDIVLTDEVFRLLAGTGMQARPIGPAAGSRRPLHLLAVPPHRLPSLGPLGASSASAACGCGAPHRPEVLRAAAALEPHADILRSLAPAVAAEGGAGAFWAHDIRTVFVVFASFPDLDAAGGGGVHAFAGPAGDGPSRHAARFGRVVRSVHRVAGEYGGSVNKIMIDDKGASAIIGFGLPGGFSHEDDAERSVRAALALQSWHRETGARFACGVASGRTFCGALGAPCRKEYALIGDCVILAARLMGKAREAVGAAAAGEGAAQASISSNSSAVEDARMQEVLCDASIVRASQGRRLAAISFEELPPVHAKGFGEVAVFRPKSFKRARSRGRVDRTPYSSANDPAIPSTPRTEAVGAQLHPASLIGREEELARAAAAVEALASKGRGATLVIEADAGFGKTRFAEEIERACVEKGFLALRASAGSLEELTPLWTLRGILSSVFDVSSADALREEAARRKLLSPADASVLWSFLFGDYGWGTSPTLESPIDRDCGNTDFDAGSHGDSACSYHPRPTVLRVPSREWRDAVHEEEPNAGVGINAVRVANALTRLFAGLEREGTSPESPFGRPIALFLEDAHWCDSASYFVLRCLRDSCPRLLLVITSRPMADPPRDYRLLSGQLIDEAGGILADRAGFARGASSFRETEPATDPKAESETRAPEEAGLGHLDPSAPNGHGREPDVALGADRDGSGKYSAAHAEHSTSRSRSRPLPMMLRRRPRDAPAKLPPIRAAVEAVLLKLGPLTPSAALALLNSLSERMGVRLPQGAEAAVVEKAGGVPLYLTELVRQLQWGGGDQAAGLAIALPDSIQQLVLARADRLSASASAALKLAAVIGQNFTCEAVAAADPTQTGLEGVRAAFRQLREANLIIEGKQVELYEESARGTAAWPPSALRFGFLHAVVRDAVYGAMPLALRRDVHARYAIWLEARAHDHGHGLDPSVLAQHWRAAERPVKALQYLERAAAQAMRGNALPESRRMYAVLAVTIDDLGLAPSPPLPARLRPAAPSSLVFRASAVPPEEAAGTEAERARWRVVRACAIRSWAMIEYRVGHVALAGDLALEAVAGLGERLPAKPASPLSTLRTLGGVLRLAARVMMNAKAGRPRREWTDDAMGRDEREALLDCLTLIVWAGMKGYDLRGPKTALGLGAAAMLRAAEISHETPSELLVLSDCRARASFVTFLDLMGLRAAAHSSLPWFEDLALHLPSEHAQMVVHNHAYMRLSRAGRFAEAAKAARAAVAAGGADPIASDSHLFLAVGLAVTGDFPGAASASEEALSFFSRFGMDESAVSIAALADGWCGILQGRDEQAQAVVSRALAQADQSRGTSTTWALQTVRLLDAVLRWRRGDVEAAAAEVERTVDYWKSQVGALMIFALPCILIATDFACWWRGYTRARLASAHGPASRNQPAWHRLLCLRPRITAGTSLQSATLTAAGPVFSGVAIGPSSSRAASPPRPQSEPQQTSSGPGHLQASAERADALARKAVALLRRSQAKHLKYLAPVADAVRAADPGVSRGRRLALLRSVREGFVKSGLRPWEALACFALSRLEPDSRAAADAALAFTRIAAQINLRLPAAERAARGEKPHGWSGGILSLWV